MEIFNSKTLLECSPALIPVIADRICETFKKGGYDGFRCDIDEGGIEIYICKGGFFKSVIGMDKELKVSLLPVEEGVAFDAGFGSFGKKTFLSAIVCLLAWPILITHLWGLMKQSRLDDKALDIAKSVIEETARNN